MWNLKASLNILAIKTDSKPSYRISYDKRDFHIMYEFLKQKASIPKTWKNRHNILKTKKKRKWTLKTSSAYLLTTTQEWRSVVTLRAKQEALFA